MASRFHASVWLTVVLSMGQSADADTLKVLTTGAFKQVVVALAPVFQAQTGHTLDIHNDTAGALTRRIAAGETFDVLVLTPSGLKAMGERGVVDPASIKPLAKVAIGVAVKSGAIKPAISSVEEFKQALQQAKRVAYIDPKSGGSSGIYLDQWFAKEGLADMVRAKAVLVQGGLVAERLVNDQADLAIHQISEILPVSGVDLVGPVPEAMQNYTVYAVAVSSQTPRVDVAKSFVAVLNHQDAAEVVRAKGMVPLR